MKTFNIYCDESTHLPNDRELYMVYGYVSIASNQIKLTKQQIKDIRARYDYFDEFKWTNLTEDNFSAYAELVKYFFQSDMQFRAVVVEKSKVDNSRPEYSFDSFYYRMYYQLLHHKMSLEHTYNVYIDIKDTCSQGRLHKLKEILQWNASINNFQFIKSHESCFVQLADVLMGALNYHLRIEYGKIEGKSISKRKLVSIIQEHTQLPLDRSTIKDANKFNLFFISLK